MITTAQEKEIIEQVIQMRTAGKRKWAYLLYGMIEERIALNMSYEYIAKWLSEEGLSINENALKQLIWSYKNQLKKFEAGKKKQNFIKQEAIKKPPSFKVDRKPEFQENPEEDIEDLNLKLQRGADELKKKNLGFDGFDGL